MSRSNKRNRGSGAIQKAGANVPAPMIDTPQGPATIQIIDFPGSALGPVMPSGPTASKGPGINVVGAVLRRWWLVILVAVFIGGSGMLLAGRLVKPQYEVGALVLYHYITPVRGQTIASDPSEVVRTQIQLLTKPEIALTAARNPELQRALPWLRGLNLEDPGVQKEVVRRLKGICEGIQIQNTELVQIFTTQPEGYVAAAVANAFADAFVEHCTTRLLNRDAVRYKKLKEQVDSQDALLKELIAKKHQLLVDNNFEVEQTKYQSMIADVTKMMQLKSEAEVKRMAAEAELAKYNAAQNDAAALDAKHKLERRKKVEEEKQKDSILAALVTEQMRAYQEYMNQKSQGKTDQHADVIMAKEAVKRAEQSVQNREVEIASVIDAKVKEEQGWMVGASLDEKRQALADADATIKALEQRLGVMDKEAHRMAIEKQKLESLNETIARTQKSYEEYWNQLQSLDVDSRTQGDAVVMVAERAEVPQQPTNDKRVKVQAASLIGGLFMGIFLALLIDRFDRRLRNPRDIEGLLNAPLLGTIPKIQELKKAKGEHARNLIAEEFRIIRTQLLFGNPEMDCRTIVITSPVPGDGKTSLSVNLAISLAKAGRRVLLVDADLRKPDVHRIFGIPESPGLSELIENTTDLSAAARKTDVENLEVMAAGMSAGRPCELLSRPQMQALLQLLAESYDHVILDSAPVLPVSDTHVLMSMVDGVLCSFNAEVDSDTVRATEEILRRNRANVIGSVMNQVSYKQSSSYQRGKSAYSSYYSYGREPGRESRNSQKDAPKLAEKKDPAVAAIGMDGKDI